MEQQMYSMRQQQAIQRLRGHVAYSSSAKTFIPHGGEGGPTITAAELYRMQWQSLQQMNGVGAVGVGAVGVGAGGGFVAPGMFDGGMSQLRYPLLSTAGLSPMHVPSPPMSTTQATFPPTAHYSATAMSRKMVLESASAMAGGILHELRQPKRQLQQQQHSDSDSDSEDDESDAVPQGRRIEQSAPKKARSEEQTAAAPTPVKSVKGTPPAGATRDNDAAAAIIVQSSSPPAKAAASELDGAVAVADDDNDRDQDLTIEEPKPKRRLSAYNLFFQHERARLLILAESDANLDDHPPRNLRLQDIRELLENNPYYTDRAKRRHRKSHGKVGFMDLVKRVSKGWKNLDKVTRASFEALANEDKVRYKREMKEYNLLMRKRKRVLASLSSSSSSSKAASQSSPHLPSRQATKAGAKLPSSLRSPPSSVDVTEVLRTVSKVIQKPRGPLVPSGKNEVPPSSSSSGKGTGIIFLKEALRIADLPTNKTSSTRKEDGATGSASEGADESFMCCRGCSHEEDKARLLQVEGE